jgi:hypothetical protein
MLQTFSVLIITIYVMTGEVYDRGEAVVQQYMEFREKQRMVLTPEVFSERKHELLTQKKS